jgi:nicotinamide-nucleotide amidase
VLRSDKNALCNSKFLTVADIFASNGYIFREIRILYQSDEKEVLSALSEIKTKSQNVLLLCEKPFLQMAKNYITKIFPSGIYQGGVEGAGIYADKDASWFLLSADDSNTGAEFAKNVCAPFLHKRNNSRFERYVIRTIGANEAHIEQLILKAKTFGKNSIAYNHVRVHGQDTLEILYDANAPKALIDDTIRLFVDGLGDCIYALEDITLEEQLVRLLKLRGRKLSVAESFTGGGIARRIVSVSGASQVFFKGLNTYDELAKIKRLGVSEYTLKTMGAVSDQTAYEMATGLLNTGNCDISIATTGIAGPKTDRSMLPVGVCFISVGVQDRVFVYRYKFDGDREDIIETAINYALFLAYKQLKNI